MLIPYLAFILIELQTHIYVLVNVHLRSFSGIRSHLTVDTYTSTESHNKSLFYLWLYGPIIQLPESSLVTTIIRKKGGILFDPIIATHRNLQTSIGSIMEKRSAVSQFGYYHKGMTGVPGSHEYIAIDKAFIFIIWLAFGKA